MSRSVQGITPVQVQKEEDRASSRKGWDFRYRQWRASVWLLKAQSSGTVTVTSNAEAGVTLLMLWGCQGP